MRSLSNLEVDRLYILDTWGYKGSYYLYENGNDYPMKMVDRVIEYYISSKKYRNVFTAGTSKGGTAAIFFGLKHSVTAVFSGACQYNLGTYLCCDKHMPIFKGMMGSTAAEKERNLLNLQMPLLLSEYEDTKTVIFLLYSKMEPTYEEEIIDLINDLEKKNITFETKEEAFKEHDQVGAFFPSYVLSCISRLKK